MGVAEVSGTCVSKKKLVVLLVVVFGVVAVVTGAYAYVSLLASPKFPSVPDKVGEWTRAVEISRDKAETEGYWALENPDQYILLAINHPSAWIYVEDDAEFRFLDQMRQHDYLWNVEFEGRNYVIDVLSLDPKSEPDKPGEWIRAVEISREVAEEKGYWALEDPDQYVLVATRYPNSWIFIEYVIKFRFLEQVPQHGHIWNIEYEGRYYDMDSISLTPQL